MALTVLVSALDGIATERIRKRFPGLNFVICNDEGALVGHAAEADVLLGWRAPAAFFRKARRLRWFQGLYVGMEWMLPIRAELGDVVVTNGRGVASDLIADFVITGIGMLHWDFMRLLREQARREWHSGPVPRLAGRTVGIVGLGSIGAAIARRCKGAGLRVIGTKRDTSRPVENVDQLFAADNLPELLRQSDYVVLAVPYTAETDRMIGRKQLSQMRRTAHLVNIARGSVMVESDLVEALREGTIAGALLDVFEKEPLPADSPLWAMPNVIVAPHISGWAADILQGAVEIFERNMVRFLAGKPLENVIDLNRGY
jgi:phosphoglycerate dehydrogenase-like enzyme